MYSVSIRALTALMCAGVLASPQAASAKSAPTITKVTLKKSGSTYTATVKGHGLGASPVALPCNACTIPELGVVDAPSLIRSEAVTITAWTDTGIAFSGITGAKNDTLMIVVKNDAAANIATWAGNLPGKSHPVVSSITFSGSGASLKMTIIGTGFGKAPSGVPGTTDVPYFEFLDWNIKAPGSSNYPWGGGWNGQGFVDTVTVNYLSWSDTQITVGGFGGAYGNDGATSSSGDAYSLLLWGTPGKTPGSTGPQTGVAGRLP